MQRLRTRSHSEEKSSPASAEATDERQLESSPTRRRLLGRGAVALAGLVALEGVAGSRSPLSLSGGDTTLALSARDVTAQVVGKPVGTQPDHGDQIITIGDLFIGRDKVGEFYSTSIHLTRSRFNPQQLAASAEQHTFQLIEGTIMGMGTASHSDEPDAFAVVGGTDSFARASGTYLANIRPYRLGGDATADFAFDLTIEGARNAH
jgi:hypothetical protein